MALTKVSQHSLGNSAVSSAKLGTAPFGFANSSANVVYMAANGNIGIGTSVTYSKLSVYEGSVNQDYTGSQPLPASTVTILNSNGRADLSFVSKREDASTTQNVARLEAEANTGWYSKLHFYTASNWNDANNQVMTLYGTNVGIGTSSPGAKLDLAGAIRLKGYQGAAGTLGDGYNASRFWIELQGSGAAGVVQKLFYADDNGAFKITYIGHFYNGGAGAANMLRCVEFYGAIGSGGAGESGIDYYFVNAANYGTAGGTDTPTLSISGDSYVQITYGTGGSTQINSRGILVEWFGSGLPTFHSSVNSPT